MARYSNDNIVNLENEIAYHREMEEIANKAGDFTLANHHMKMQETYKAMKEIQHQQLSHENPDRLLDEDYKQAPKSGDNENLHE
jgi:hypothetical protein